MNIVQRINKKNVDWLFVTAFQLLLLIFFLLNSAFHDVPITDVIKVFLFQLFAWGLTGYAVFLLLKIKTRNVIETMALSYALGITVSLIAYLLFMLPKLGFLLPAFTIVESIAAIAVIYKYQTEGHQNRAALFDKGLCLGVLGLFLLITLVVVSFVNTMPNETANGSGYYVDWLFWAGNNVAFTRSFPADCLRQVGSEFRYHYFSSLLMAHTSICTGVDINVITFYISGILSSTVFVLSGFYIATRIRTRKIYLPIIMMILLLTDGLSVTQSWHTILCPFGFDYAFSFSMLSTGVLFDMVMENKVKEMMIPSVLFIGMATGFKGPMGAILLVAYEMFALVLIFRKEIKRGLILALSSSGIFLLVYRCFISSSYSSESSPSGLKFIGGLDIDTIIAQQSRIQDMYNFMTSIYRIQSDHLILKIYTVWLYLFRVNRVVMFLMVAALIFFIVSLIKKRFDPLLFCLVPPSIVGVLLTIYTSQQGGSQMYFVMSVFPLAALAGIYAIDKLSQIDKRYCKSIYLGVLLVVVLLLGQSTDLFYGFIRDKFREGMCIVRDRYEETDYSLYYTSPMDYEAFEWLRDNSDNDSVFAIDSYVDQLGRPNYMTAAVFSERFAWNTGKYAPDEEKDAERLEVLLQLWNDPDGVIDQLREEGVDYLLIQVRDGKPDLALLSGGVEEVFRNPNYIIYELV